MNNREGKNIISRILEEKRQWNHVNKSLPDPDQRVVIRIVHDTAVFYEDETKVYPAEDMKIGRCINAGDDTIRWVVDPPYPRFDYSPLSCKDKIASGAKVTHWAVPEDGELDAWDHRFDINMAYKDLHISVDADNREMVYRAIMWGASFLGRSMQESQDNPDEIKALWVTLCDLQSCFDQDIEIKNGKIIHLDTKATDENSSINEVVNEMKHFADSSENICKIISNTISRILVMDSNGEYKNDIENVVSRLWVLHDVLLNDVRKYTVKETEGASVDHLPPMFYYKLGERLFNSMTDDERKQEIGKYTEKYINPYENKEE